MTGYQSTRSGPVLSDGGYMLMSVTYPSFELLTTMQSRHRNTTAFRKRSCGACAFILLIVIKEHLRCCFQQNGPVQTSNKELGALYTKNINLDHCRKPFPFKLVKGSLWLTEKQSSGELRKRPLTLFESRKQNSHHIVSLLAYCDAPFKQVQLSVRHGSE